MGDSRKEVGGHFTNNYFNIFLIFSTKYHGCIPWTKTMGSMGDSVKEVSDHLFSHGSVIVTMFKNGCLIIEGVPI